MYKAVGWHSKNEYMAGNSLADVVRKLQKEYPAPIQNKFQKSSKKFVKKQVCRFVQIYMISHKMS
ncbi:hypothetical protein [Leuconostoc mesenteroides]|uniref:hypothetical protein n=1 Tax=Leuconostoc mesenteroides TaxID=1245 RepID=UPI00236227DB|nr:hypothetical protein [Leuconostoc mesenteroides]